MEQCCQNIMRWFLSIFSISYMAGIVLFIRLHVVSGVTIVYLHPFRGDPSHNRTTVEFQLIHLLSRVITTGAGFFSLSLQFIACLLYALSRRPERARYHSSITGMISLKASSSAV